MMKTECLQIVFAHIDEPVPPEFWDYAKPNHAENLPKRLQQKWHSRRLARFLLHKLFEQQGLDTTLLADIHKTESGRPFVSHPNVDFNISHSGEWVAVIFSVSEQKKVVGIDIEHPQKTRRYQSLLDYYADTQEIAELNDTHYLPQLPNLAQRFYLSWCLREAILKSQGVGIVKLSEVKHRLSRLQIYSAHCPKGILAFYHQLPFYLAYFTEQQTMADLYCWQQNQLYSITTYQPIIYQVNL